MKINTLTLQELFRNDAMQALDTFAKAQDVRLYLVGGSVRDLLLKRRTTDFDFALAPNAIRFAKAFAAHIRATCIVLEENPSTARVIVKQDNFPDPSRLSMDFVQFRAESLADDLRLRDLTINAMAIVFENVDTLAEHAHKSSFCRVIDPCGGMEDLETGLLRFPSDGVILADPIRLLRIYRFAAQLGFEISQNAIALIQKHQELLPSVAAERCRDEFMKILDVKKAHPYLQQMNAVGLLAQMLPTVNRERIPWQPLKSFEGTPIPLRAYDEEINNYLQEELGGGVSRYSLVKLSLLLDGNFADIGERLQLSRKATQFVENIISKYEQFFKNPSRQLTRGEIICFLRTAAADWWGVLLYAAALHAIDSAIIKKIADTYYKHILPIHKQGRLVTGDDLIQIFHLKEGKQVGDLLEQIEERQFNGEIRTRKEALAAVRALIRQSQ